MAGRSIIEGPLHAMKAKDNLSPDRHGGWEHVISVCDLNG